jgi:uncharacterized SAM-binding protein YcdF (DUF218 family)
VTKKEIDELARKLWDYHHLHQRIRPCDAIFTLCSTDHTTAYRAVELFKQGYGTYLIFSGGLGRVSRHTHTTPEAQVFARIAKEQGVPENRIIVEDRSSNTGENIVFTLRLLKKQGLDIRSFLLVQKPYMERRLYATVKMQWPDPQPEILITSPQIPFDEYIDSHVDREHVINMMVGDIQRIAEYPKLGFQISQEIPDDIWDAYQKLILAGYTKQLIKDK